MDQQHTSDETDTPLINGGEAEKGVSTIVFTMIVCTILILGAGGFMYMIIRDWNDGNQAYRVKAMRDQRDGYKASCEDNFKRFSILQKYVEQQQLKPSPDLMVAMPCTQPEPPEMGVK